jgi:hypothetical protein
MRLLSAILPDSDTMKFLLGMIVGFFFALWAWGSLSGVREQFVVLDSRLVELRRELNALAPRLTELEKLDTRLVAVEKLEEELRLLRQSQRPGHPQNAVTRTR